MANTATSWLESPSPVKPERQQRGNVFTVSETLTLASVIPYLANHLLWCPFIITTIIIIFKLIPHQRS